MERGRAVQRGVAPAHVIGEDHHDVRPRLGLDHRFGSGRPSGDGGHAQRPDDTDGHEPSDRPAAPLNIPSLPPHSHVLNSKKRRPDSSHLIYQLLAAATGWLQSPQIDGQAFLCAIQGPNLSFFVTRQDKGVIRRVHVQTHHINELRSSA